MLTTTYNYSLRYLLVTVSRYDIGYTMKRRTIEKGQSVTINMSTELVDKMDKYWREKGMASRSHLIEEACAYYIELAECPSCGTKNPKGARKCAICGCDISYSVNEYVIHELGVMLRTQPERFENLIKKIDPEINEWLDIREKEMKEIKKSGEYYEGA
jgi:ribosomal protein L40E